MNWYKTAKQGSDMEPWVRYMGQLVLNSIKRENKSDYWNVMNLLDKMKGKTVEHLQSSEMVWAGLKMNIKVEPAEAFRYKSPLALSASHQVQKMNGRPTGKTVITVDIHTSEWPINPKLYNFLLTQVQYVIRHELEHFNQFKGNYEKWKKARETYHSPNGAAAETRDILTGEESDNSIKDPLEARRAYYLQPNEIQAYVAGFYYKAKKNREPVKKLMDDEIRNIILGLSFENYPQSRLDEFSVDLRRAWYTEASQRYQKANIQRPMSKDEIAKRVQEHKVQHE